MGILWFGVDDAATSCLTPIYCSTKRVPENFSVESGTMLDYTPESAFWLFNRVTNFAYLRYDMISADIRKVVDSWENRYLEVITEEAESLATMSPAKRQKMMTNSSVERADDLFKNWQILDRYLLTKYVDGNLKSEHGTVLDYMLNPTPKHFLENGNGKGIPDKIQYPGYNEAWKRMVAADNGEVLKVVK
ncbi:MAG: C69 family dipeptidase, partial [Alistipes sp.]|nr:C69 family dipeptidase [Alistipes sp.]